MKVGIAEVGAEVLVQISGSGGTVTLMDQKIEEGDDVLTVLLEVLHQTVAVATGILARGVDLVPGHDQHLQVPLDQNSMSEVSLRRHLQWHTVDYHQGLLCQIFLHHRSSKDSIPTFHHPLHRQ